MEDVVVFNAYRLGKCLGKGSFGQIYEGEHLKTREQVAIKLEPVDAEHPQLRYESKLYHQLRGDVGVPRILWFGVDGEYNALVLEKLGANLETLFDKCKRRFTPKTVAMLADQMLSRIEMLHSHHFVHRDIKPDNFLMGVGPFANVLYIIDLGLAKKYKDRQNQHIAYCDGKSLTGTARYASLNTHLGIQQSRRDDLEAIGHMMIYFLKGRLPWQGFRAESSREKYDQIKQCKLDTSLEALCEGVDPVFHTYMRYCRKLKFEERPNYHRLRQLFIQYLEDRGSPMDYRFDWA